MWEIIKKMILLFGNSGKTKKEEKKGTGKVNWNVLIPAAIGATVIVAGTAFIVYKTILKKRAALPEEKEKTDEENGALRDCEDD